MYKTPKQPPVKPLNATPVSDSKLASWTLSYRLRGMSIAMIGVGIYNYLFWPEWEIKFLIAGAILGYFLGWIIGHFTYSKKE
jgi:hypothetical protein